MTALMGGAFSKPGEHVDGSLDLGNGCCSVHAASPTTVVSTTPPRAIRLVTIDDIRAAAELIGDSVVRTPLVAATWADPSRPLWIKVESVQPVGSFKLRGAFNAIGRLDASARAKGIVADSSGNHALAVAYAAATFGIPAHIVMPRDTPNCKVQATRDYGAEVVLCEVGTRAAVAADLVEKTGGVLVSSSDHPDVIAGQGTIGLEIIDDLPDVANVLVPLSGGGLTSGIGTAIKALRPNAAVFGVEPELAADAAEGLRAGRRADWPAEVRNRTIAEGLRSQPSELTFAHLQHVLDGVIAVSDNAIRAAVGELAVKAHLVSETSGAAALAAYRERPTPPGPTVIILSGGNIEPALLREILAGC
jgi:threonine dehydratase